MTVHPAWCEGAASEVQKCTTLGGANMPLKQWLNVWKLLWLVIRVVESSNPLLVLTLLTVSAPLEAVQPSFQNEKSRLKLFVLVSMRDLAAVAV